MLELSNVSKHYGDATAVDDVSLTAHDGEFLTLLGPSGSGKSTVLGMIAGYLSPDAGAIRLDGRDLVRVSAADRGIGVVFQHYALFPHMTVAENIAYGLRRRRWPRKKVAARVAEMLELIDIERLGQRRPSQLSGGQQQRVALARALAFEPRLLLMDEPLGALDREIRGQMQEHIRRIHAELRPTVIYVTHDKGEAFALSDRIGIMRDSRLVAIDSPAALYNAPESAFVARFFGGHHLVPAQVLDGGGDGATMSVQVGGSVGKFARRGLAPDDRSLSLAVFEEGVRLAQDDGAGAPDGLAIRAVVRDRVYHGGTTQLWCTTVDGAQIGVTVPSGSVPVPTPGQSVTLTIDPERCRLVSGEAALHRREFEDATTV